MVIAKKICLTCGESYSPTGNAQRYCTPCKPRAYCGRLCTKCSTNPCTGASPWCRECLNRLEATRRIKLKQAGACENCVVAPCRTGKNTCQECADTISQRECEKRSDNKRLAVEWAGGKCFDCGFTTDVLEVYDFHHLDPTKKDFTLGYLVNFSWERMLPELEKCVMLCANCHRIRHYTT